MPELRTLIRFCYPAIKRAIPGMHPSWMGELVQSLRRGRFNPILDQHLDALLLWLGNPRHPGAAALDQAIRQQLDPAQARAIAFLLLDQRLFAGENRSPAQTLGLEPGVDPEVAKQRYRRLIKVYHPDRHPDRTDWATRRTEQLNRAFAAIQRGDDRARPGRPPTQRTAEHQTQQQGSPGSAARIGDWPMLFWAWAQSRLQARPLFDRRLLVILTLVGLFALAGLFWPKERPKPAPRILHQPLSAETPRIIGLNQPEPSPPQEQPAQASAQTAPERPNPPPPGSGVKAQADQPEPIRRKQGSPETRPAPSPPPAVADQPAVSPQLPIAEGLGEPVLSPPSPDWHLPPPWDRPPLMDTPRRFPALIPVPEPPSPPLIPLPPAAEVDLASPPSSLTDPGGCLAALELLERFKNAYQDGALDQLMTLYSPLARENDLTSWFAIRQAYETWFKLTLLRRIDFSQIEIQPLPKERLCALRARYQVGYLDQQARLATQTGDLNLVLESKGSDWLILEARY